MSLEAYRTRLRALEIAARKLATSVECSVTSEPELIQIAIQFHPAEGTSTARQLRSGSRSSGADFRSHREHSLDSRQGGSTHGLQASVIPTPLFDDLGVTQQQIQRAWRKCRATNSDP
jgi:hypothetical protein